MLLFALFGLLVQAVDYTIKLQFTGSACTDSTLSNPSSSAAIEGDLAFVSCEDQLDVYRVDCQGAINSTYVGQFGPMSSWNLDPTSWTVPGQYDGSYDLTYAACTTGIVANQCIVPGDGALSAWGAGGGAPNAFVISCAKDGGKDVCQNGIKDAWEEETDCGPTCVLTAGVGVLTGIDQPCADTCSNGEQDGNEQGIDCGGDCDSCARCNAVNIQNFCANLQTNTDIPNTSSHVLITNPQFTNCKGLTCVESDTAECCQARPTCFDFEQSNCQSIQFNSVLIADPQLTFCSGSSTDRTNCDTLAGSDDATTCCSTPATCSQFASDGNSCQDPMYLKNSTQLAASSCTGGSCVQSDNVSCCLTKGKCNTVSCGDIDNTPYSPIDNADTTFGCATETCDPSEGSADHAACCITRESCSQHTCENGFIDADNKASLYCNGDACDSDDNSRCCVAVPKCTEVQNLCQASENKYPKTQEPIPYCTSGDCSGDNEICCDVKKSCAAFSCGTGYTTNTTALCAAADCDPATDGADFGECCLPHDLCIGNYAPSGCNSATSYLTEDSTKRCNAMLCDSTNDASQCCTVKMSCAGYSGCASDGSQELVGAPGDKYCAKDTCDSTDDATACCDNFASCDTYTCPPETTVDATGTNYCAATDCSNDANALTDCCDDKMQCTVLSCGNDYVNKGTGYCDDTTCVETEGSTDHTTCCTVKAQCKDLWAGADCPQGYSRLTDTAADVYCAGTSCGSDDTGTCCVVQETCADMTCPSKYTKINTDQNCAGFTCDPSSQADLTTCCQENPGCDSIECGSGKAPLATPTVDYKCEAATCAASTQADFDACCGDQFSCLGVQCPTDWDQDSQNGFEKCSKSPCDMSDTSDSGDVKLCCNSNQLCREVTDACAGNYAIDFDNKGDRVCATQTCDVSTNGEGDFDLCCSATASCGGSTLCFANNQTKNFDNISEKCAGVECTTADNAVCCNWNQKCSASGACPTDYEKITANADKYCSTATCALGLAEADVDLCCQEENKADCSTLADCQHGWNEGQCAGDPCASSDATTCCKPAPTGTPTEDPTREPTGTPTQDPTDAPKKLTGDLTLDFGSDVQLSDVNTDAFKNHVKGAIANSLDNVEDEDVTITDVTIPDSDRRRADSGSAVKVGFEVETDGSTVTSNHLSTGLGDATFVSNLNTALSSDSTITVPSVSGSTPANLELVDPNVSPNSSPVVAPTPAPEEKSGGGGAGIAIGITIPLLLAILGVAGWKLGWFEKCNKKDGGTTSDFTKGAGTGAASVI